MRWESYERRGKLWQDSIYGWLLSPLNGFDVSYHCLHLCVFRYVPRKYYEANPELKKAIDQIHDGFFSPKEPALFHDLTEHLLNYDT